jgi:hypothetical protein
LWHFHPAGAPANDIRGDAPLDHGLARRRSDMGLVFGLDHAVNDHFFFADVDLRLFLRRQSAAHARHLVVFEGALSLAAAHSQLVKLGDHVLSLDSQFFCEQMDSRLSHLFLLPVSSLELLHQRFLCGLAGLSVKSSKMTLATYKHFPTILGSMQITPSPLPCVHHNLSLVRHNEANHPGSFIPRGTA